MGDVISATTRFGRAGGARERFLASAHDLLGQARGHVEAKDWALALECSYQAALRTAGARNATSSVIAKRKRLPGSAWDRLRLVDDRGEARAAEFTRFSGLRSRVASGIVPDPDPAIVLSLLELTADFLTEVDAESGWASVA